MSQSPRLPKNFFRGFATPATAIGLLAVAFAVFVWMWKLHIETPAFVWLALTALFLVDANLDSIPPKWMTKGFAVALVGAATICAIF